MGGRRGRKAVTVVFAASIAASGIVVMLPPLVAQAAAPTVTVPGLLYPGVNQAIAFDNGQDPISGDTRKITVDGLIDGACNPTSGNQYDTSGCSNVQLSYDDNGAGLLRVPLDGSTPVNIDADPEPDRIALASGAVLTQFGDPNGKDARVFHITGKAADIQESLDTLQIVPCSQQIGSDIVPPPDPSEVDPNPYDEDCGQPGHDPHDITKEIPYEEKNAVDEELPSLSITAVNTDGSDMEFVYFKFESDNLAPTMTGPVSPLDVAAGATTDVETLTTDVDVTDPEMCNNFICGDPFENPGLSEGDDEMLLVAWIPEPSCGKFSFIVSAGLFHLGGPTRNSVHTVLREWASFDLGLDLNDTEQSAAADAIAVAVEAQLSPNAVALDLSTQPSDISSLTTVFAGTGDLDEVKWAISHIDYQAPNDDATCHININVSDLGNNGTPLSYVGSPYGPEEPHGPFASKGIDAVDVPYEVPNAKSDIMSLAFNVKDGHPSVTIDQLFPGPLGSPAGPNKPSSFTITFGEPIDPASFDTSDLELTTSNAAVPGLGALVPITPGLMYSVPVTASGGDTTLKLEFTGSSCAAGHFPGATCDSGFDTEAPTYSDNEIDWDETGPTVTIDKKVGQADPTSVPSAVFTVVFSDTISTAPIGFDAGDIDLSDSTTGPGTHVSDVSQPDMLDLKTYEVTVTGMTSAGDVIAKVKQDAIVDTALNGNQESTSTDNSVEYSPLPVVSIDDVSLMEGDVGTTTLTFTVTLDKPAVGGEALMVNTSDVVDGATAGLDYVALSNQPVFFSMGQATQTVSVTINGDETFEPNEDFDITLSAPMGVVIVDGTGVGTILNDDSAPAATITPSFVQEGDAGMTPMTFAVVLDSAAVGGESVVVTPSLLTASVDDLDSLTPKTVTFNAGDNIKFVTFDVVGDMNPELNEKFQVTLGSPAGLQIAQGTAEGEILNDDVEVAISAATSVAEGAAGNLTLSITPAIHEQFFVRVSTTDVTAISGVPDADFIAQSMVLISVPADATSVAVPIATIDDNDVENAETFSVTVMPPASQAPNFTVRIAAGADTGTVTIQDDDVPSVVTIEDAIVSEGGAANQIKLSMTNFTGRTCTALITTSNGSAAAPADFVALTAADFDIIEAGLLFVPLTIVDDPDPEGTQFFTVNIGLSPDLNCVLGAQTSATVLIADNEVIDDTKPAPIVSKAAAQDDPTNASPILFDVDFGEPVTGFGASDVVFGTPPTGATLTPTVTGGPTVYQVSVAVSGATDVGSVQISVAADAASDALGNTSNASNQASVAFDPVAPTVEVTKAAAQDNPTNDTTILFTVTFSEPVTGFATGDVTVSGTAGPTNHVVVPVSQTVYTVQVSGMTGDGNVTAFVDSSEALDLAGNPNEAAPASATVVFDGTGPTVTIDQAAGQADPTSDASIEFDVVFSEVVTDFADGDVVLSGTAGASITAAVTGSGTNYTVSVSGMTQSGTVTASIAADVAHDAVGNGNSLATFTDHTVQFNLPPDNTKPTVTINQAAAQADPTTGTSITFTVVFSESVAGFAANDVTIGGTAGATTAQVSGSDANYTVTITGMIKAGTVTASIPAGAAQDAATNTSEASTSSDNSVQFNQPVINVSTAGGTVAVTVTTGGVLTAASGAAPQVPPPNGVTFPFGQLTFSADSTPGGLVVFQLTLPSPVTTYYKLVSGAWQEFTFDGETGVQVNGNVLTITIRDNGRGDSDLTSGKVTDPGAPAVVAQVPPTTPTTSPTTSPTTAPGTLPPTGSSSTNNLLVAATLFIGVGLLLAGARRRQSSKAKA